MTQDAARLLKQALQLPDNERADLAALLLESLDEADAQVPEADGDAELQRRVQEIHDGKADLVPWAEARRMIMDDSDDIAHP